MENIIDSLRDGLELKNYGSGWFLMKPYIPYKSRGSFRVKGYEVDRLVSCGKLKITMHSRSMSAELTNQNT